jgi:hypothetical protein
MNFKDFFNYFLLRDSIENIKFKGEWNSEEGHGWDKSDIGILKSPVGLNKIKTSWKIKQPVDIYFIKNENTKAFGEHGSVSKKYQDRVLDYILPNEELVFNPNHINILYISNRGDEKIPSTSWILAHRFGHALGVVDTQFDANPLYTKIRRAVDDLFNNVSNFVYQRDMSVDYTRYSGQKSRELKPGESKEEHRAKLIQNKE